MKTLIITNLFPNNQQPDRGIFNKQQFVRLAKHHSLEVVAPLPWFPKLPLKSSKSVFADIKKEETIDGIKTYHPRYLVVPKLSRAWAGYLYYLGIRNDVTRIYKKFPFDVILATWAYPDCFAAYLISQKFSKPLISKVHGSDINILAQYPFQRRLIKKTFQHSKTIISVTEDLKQKITSLGIDPKKIKVIPNGVDTQKFKPLDKQSCRRELKLPLDKKIILFVGNLTGVKGLNNLTEAVKELSDETILVIVGDGELRKSLQDQIAQLNIKDKVMLVGKKPHTELVKWFGACDVFCLPSLNEGCPNVILEALACGRCVVATSVGGIPEIIYSDQFGLLVEANNPSLLAQSLKRALQKPWDENKIRHYALNFSWDKNVEDLMNVLKQSL